MFTSLTIGTRNEDGDICVYLNANNQTAVFSRMMGRNDVFEVWSYSTDATGEYVATFGGSFDAINFSRSIA